MSRGYFHNFLKCCVNIIDMWDGCFCLVKISFNQAGLSVKLDLIETTLDIRTPKVFVFV